MIQRSRYDRPAPRQAPGPPPNIHDDVEWHRKVEPRESYRIVYLDKDGDRSERIVDLLKVGKRSGHTYYGVVEAGKFKTMRADRILAAEAITLGHPPSIRPLPTYKTVLPNFPVEKAVHKMPALAAGSSRTWTVDLNAYTCTCPEKRIRAGLGYKPGELGWVCPHMARAILKELPEDAPWDGNVLEFLADPTKVHVDNLA